MKGQSPLVSPSHMVGGREGKGRRAASQPAGSVFQGHPGVVPEGATDLQVSTGSPLGRGWGRLLGGRRLSGGWLVPSHRRKLGTGLLGTGLSAGAPTASPMPSRPPRPCPRGRARSLQNEDNGWALDGPAKRLGWGSWHWLWDDPGPSSLSTRWCGEDAAGAGRGQKAPLRSLRRL